MSQIELYDTTLRDGAQYEGISLSVGDKLAIARRLDQLGVHYIEGGWSCQSRSIPRGDRRQRPSFGEMHRGRKERVAH